MTLGEGLQEEASIELGIQGQASTGPCLPATHCPAHPGCPLFLSALQPQLHQTRIASFLALFAEQQVEEGGLLPTSPLPSHLLPLPPG